MKRNKGNILATTLIILLLAAILLAVTKPDNEQHLQAIKDKVTQEETLSNLIKRGELVIDPPAYHSAIVVSYTKREDKLATLGALGYVWVDENAFK